MIPEFDATDLVRAEPVTLEALAHVARDLGFLTVSNTILTPERMDAVFAAYRAFFHLPEADKAPVDMARTGANRGWGRPGSEQVDPDANPDYKEVFDMGFALPPEDPQAHLAVYAPNLWPEAPEGFRDTLQAYWQDALTVAHQILRALALALGRDGDYFATRFDRPMALLRGNYYPPRPDWAGEKDFGIAAHTDYGCLTLLASDGVPGLEVQTKDGAWVPVAADPGTFIINFGEMLEMWTAGAVKATPHRVRGSRDERISVPLFFNPNFDADVAPPGAAAPILAGDHLSRRFAETYLHMKAG